MMQCIQNKECVGLVKRNLQSIKQFNSGGVMDKVCFIITPIGKEGTEIRKNADEVLECIINPVCDSFCIYQA